MKPIKITDVNRDKIEGALAEVNGKASGFTTTEYAIIKVIADNAAKDIATAAGGKKYLSGCKIIRCNAGSVAKSYRYTRIATEVIIEYRKTGAYLVAVNRVKLWPNTCGYRIVKLTDAATTAIRQHAIDQLSY
jgi:hypothetical protein